MKKVLMFISVVTVLVNGLVLSAFGQDISVLSADATTASPDVANITKVALAIAGAVGTVAVSYIRNMYKLSGTNAWLLYFGISAVISVGVTVYYIGFKFDNIVTSMGVIFTVGQMVYQLLIKDSPLGDAGKSF